MKADVYKLYSCKGDSGVGRFLEEHGVAVTYKNMQVPYVRRRFYEIIDEYKVDFSGFPLIHINDKVVVGFKPRELLNIINEGE